jgi:hypothetical protein
VSGNFTTAQERLDNISEAAAGCRLLGHDWPRPDHPRYHELVTVTVLKKTRAWHPKLIEERMVCAAGCGVIRTSWKAVNTRTGRMERLRARYDYSQTNGSYRLKDRDPNGEKYEPVDPNEVGYALLTRMYPDLHW